jgi:hypothetical protein
MSREVVYLGRLESDVLITEAGPLWTRTGGALWISRLSCGGEGRSGRSGFLIF